MDDSTPPEKIATTSAIEKYDALKIYTTAIEAEKALLNKIAETSLPDLCYAYKSRVKSEAALLDKVQRKKQNGPDAKISYDLLEITDVIGIRFITLFRSNMPNVVHEILKLITHKIDLSPNPFKKSSIEEIKVYHVPHIEDPIIPDLEKHIDTFGLNHLFETIPKGEYSSIHIVARLQYKTKDFLKYSQNEDFFIPVEIQIRTVFEDAWGEIDHKYGYVIREGKAADQPVNNPESIHSHLKVLKKFVDASSQYADQISKEASSPATKTHNSGALISVGNDDDLITRFRDLKIDEDLISAYIHLRNKRDGIVNNETSSLPSLADEFNVLATSANPGGSELGKTLFYFYSKMNEAFCLLSTKTAEHVKVALNIYKDLISSYKEYPIVHHRIGQAYGRLGDYRKAISHLSHCASMIVEAKSRNAIGNDSIPRADFKHLQEHTPILLGYSYWAEQHYNKSLEDSKKIELLKEACKVTKEVLCANDADKKRVLNNLLYYYLDLRNLSETNEITDIDRKITELLQGIEKLISTDSESDLDLLDTLAKAYKLTKHIDKAEETCERIIKLSLENTPAETDADIVLEIAQEAWAMIHKIKSSKKMMDVN